MGIKRVLKLIGFYLFARPFVAGETIDDAIKAAHRLKQKNIYAIINILGEHVSCYEGAGRFFYQYSQLISRLAAEGLDGVHISIKPSQLGVEFSRYFYGRYLIMLLKQAQALLPNSFVEIDREDHEYAQDIREISLVLARDFQNIRVACQINLNETLEEIQQFIKAGISVRLCKGTAYSGDTKDEKEIRKRFLEQALLLSKTGNRPAMATHDLRLIDELQMEQQVLLGIENKKMEKLARAGRKVGFYVPCGPNWYSYGKRRWKSIVRIIARNSFYRMNRFFHQLGKLILRGIEISGENNPIPW